MRKEEMISAEILEAATKYPGVKVMGWDLFETRLDALLETSKLRLDDPDVVASWPANTSSGMISR
jgi:hypothetical protein